MRDIKNATNKRNPEGKPISFVPIARRKNPKSFQIPVYMFNAYSLTRNLVIVGFIFGCQGMFFRGFARNQTVLVNFINSGIARIQNSLNSFGNMYSAFLENPKIMHVSLRNGKTDDIQGFRIYDQLNLQRVSFFLPGVVTLLFFWGRSISHSVASTKTTSISKSSINAFLDGRLNLLLFMRDSSAQRILS